MIFPRVIPLYFLLLLGLIVSGCGPTMAQQEYQEMRNNISFSVASYSLCAKSWYNSPEYSIVRANNPFDSDKATLAQKMNKNYITEEERTAVLSVYSVATACRQAYLDQLKATNPTLIPVIVNSWTKSENSLIDLLEGRQCWGDYVRGRCQIALELRHNINEEAKMITARLEQSHQVEMAQRQLLAETIIYALDAYSRTQYRINAMNSKHGPATQKSGPTHLITNLPKHPTPLDLSGQRPQN